MAYESSKITAVPYFYDKQLRKYIQQFIRIFAGFQVAMHINEEGEVVYQTVPVRYGDVSRMAAHIVRENSENMLQTTPFISCHVTGLEVTPERRTYPQYEETMPVYEKKYNEATNSYENEIGQQYAVKRHQPVPYNLTMQVDLWTSNTEQKLQILEQILVLFNPTLNIHTNNNPLDWSTLSYVELISSTWSMRAIPSGVDDIIDISTLTFTVPVLINPPAKVIRNTVIHTIIDNIEEVDDTQLANLRAGNNYTPLFTSFKVVTLEQFKMKFEIDSAGNTQGVVDAVINPQTNTPGDGTLSAASNGDRYLITADIAGGTGWLGSTAKKNDIIQYDSGGSQWNIVFDASSGSSPQIITNNTTQDKLKWNGTNWVNAFEGTYNPGFWRLYI